MYAIHMMDNIVLYVIESLSNQLQLLNMPSHISENSQIVHDQQQVKIKLVTNVITYICIHVVYWNIIYEQ